MTADRAHQCPVHTHINAMTKRHSGMSVPFLLLRDSIAIPILLVCNFCCAVATLTVDELLDGAFLEQGMPASTKAERGAAVGQRNVRGDTSALRPQLHDFYTTFKCSSIRCCRHDTA